MTNPRVRKIESLTPFGRYLRNFREERRLSLGECARFLGVSLSYVSGMENGHRPPPIDFVERVTSVFQVSEREQRVMQDLVLLERADGSPQPWTSR